MTAIQSPHETIVSLSESAVQELQQHVRGNVIRPGDAAYDTARRVYNTMIDKHPALIVRCATVADIIAGVDFARAQELPLTVRGGGHNVAGLGTCDGGLVIDLAELNGVRVDPARKTARVAGGATWGQVDHATYVIGLATPSGIISTTGVAGLTLGGGFGHLSRHYGLSCDNLLSADIVTADGRFRMVSAEQHPDLFWAIRGGGGNFGVVTSFEFQLHPVDTILGGLIFYPVDETVDVMRAYRDYMRQAPDEMSAFFSFHLAPAAPFIPEELHFKPFVTIVACYSGADLKQGETVVKPLKELGNMVFEHIGPLPYPALNSAFDAILPAGLYHYWKADYVPSLTDAAIKVHAEYGPKVPSVESTMHLYPQTGAIQQVGKRDTAYWHRDVEYIHNIVAVDPDPAKIAEHIAWMQGYYNALRSHSGSGGYVNFMTGDEGQERVRATYGDNYDRLVEIKTKYDPTNLFRVNHNIKPATQV
jgi:FAD/FMN-containing dehydrogenase